MVTTRASSAASATPSADPTIRLTARVPESQADLAVAECHALTGVGCMQGEPVAGVVPLDIWMPGADSPGAERLRAHLAAAGIPALVEEAIESEAWRSALRDFHQPVLAGRMRVRPPWVAPIAGMHDIVIDPGMAFGTGQHPTTRTALELLQHIPITAPVLDAGCGSGVLAIAARRLGMGPVVAVDFDPDSVSATARAATANMVDGITARRATIGEDPLPAAPILLANITLEVLQALARALSRSVPDTARGQAPGSQKPMGMGDRHSGGQTTAVPVPVRHAVLSGLREHEVDAAAAAFAVLGLVEQERVADGGWASVRLAA